MDRDESRRRSQRCLRSAATILSDAAPESTSLPALADRVDDDDLRLVADDLAEAGDGLDLSGVFREMSSGAASNLGWDERSRTWRRRACRYLCPECGYLVSSRPPGSYATCPICRWEDDDLQLRWPDLAGGANRRSLLQHQRELAAGRGHDGTRPRGRAPDADDLMDPGFRIADPASDYFEERRASSAPWPADPTTLSWWRSTYWRRDRPEEAFRPTGPDGDGRRFGHPTPAPEPGPVTGSRCRSAPGARGWVRRR